MEANQATEWKVDSEGFVECPVCGAKKRAGTGGVGNIQKNHTGSQICKDKAAKRKKGDKMKEGSLFGFLKRGRPKPVPSTVAASSVQQISNSSSVPSLPCTQPGPSQIGTQPEQITRTSSTFLSRLQQISVRIPSTVPEATSANLLAQFADPAAYDNANILPDDLWEETLNPFLKTVLGWGKEVDLTREIRRGRLGFEGLVEFVRYFTQTRGVNEALFEGKLENLMESAERIIGPESSQCLPSASPVTKEPIEISDDDEILVAMPTPRVEVDSVKTVSKSGKKPIHHSPCRGYVLSILDGHSPYTTYPFGLHDLHPLPWSPSIDANGTLRLFARACEGQLSPGEDSCAVCQGLRHNTILEGISTRMEHGIAENTPFLYHGISGLIHLLSRKNERIEQQHLRGLNHARSLLGKATALADHKRFLVAIASGEVERVDRLIRIALGQNKGIKAILLLFDRAAKGLYHPKSFSEEDEMRGILLWRIGGNRLAYFANKALGLPSVNTLRARTISPPIIPSHAKPTTVEVEANIEASFESVLDVVRSQGTVLHAVLMLDEIATEKRIRLDLRTDDFVGVCRQHGQRTSLKFSTADDLEELFHALDDGEVHYAAEATVGALGILCDNNRIYPARAILISGDCKRETGPEHAMVLQMTLDSVENKRDLVNIRIVSIASDGEKRRGAAMAQLTFKKLLSPESNIFPLLSGLAFMDMHVGNDDLTCDKDWKHLFKRLRNLLLRERGIVIAGIRITPAILRKQLTSEGATADHIRALFNPDDLQDVRIAFDMLKDIWSLPILPSKPDQSPGFQNTRRALWTFGRLLLHLIFPFLCVDLSLSEQLEHLSAAAHLSLVLYQTAGKDFLPTELYLDLMLMIKNAYFCVAKAKVDNPLGDGSFWIILLGTDRLEQLFGILRTMVGNNVNVDIYQLAERLSGTTEVSNILAKYPQWDRGPRRLKLPTLTKESGELVARYDHLTPASWKGDVKLCNVTLLTSWRRGRRIVEEESPSYADILSAMENERDVTILSPCGRLLVNIPLPRDDVDESLEDVVSHPPSTVQTPITTTDDQVVIEDIFAAELVEQDINISNTSQAVKTGLVTYRGQEMSKIKALSLCSKYRVAAASTDRLRRVQEIGRHFSARSSNTANLRDSGACPISSERLLVIQDPIASILHCDGNIWLCIGEVNGLKNDGESVDFIEYGLLSEPKISVSYQLLGLRATDSLDDPTMKHDWRTYQNNSEASFTVPGRLVQPIDPETPEPASIGDKPFYLLDSQVLVALAASVFETLTKAERKSVPQIGISAEYPYRERLGKASFLCQNQSEPEYTGGIDSENPDSIPCPLCASPPVFLNRKNGQRILEHLGAHILFDKKISRVDEPCGGCLRPGAMCPYFLKKGKGIQGKLKIDNDRTRACPTRIKFTYSIAIESMSTAPCSNVPVVCPSCPKEEPAVWRYNLQQHYLKVHTNLDHAKYAHHWKLTRFETEEMKEIWAKRQRVVIKRPKKSSVPALVVSDAHRSHIPAAAQSEPREASVFTQDSDSDDDEGSEKGEESGEDNDKAEDEARDGAETSNREICDSFASFYSGLSDSDYIAENSADVDFAFKDNELNAIDDTAGVQTETLQSQEQQSALNTVAPAVETTHTVNDLDITATASPSILNISPPEASDIGVAAPVAVTDTVAAVPGPSSSSPSVQAVDDCNLAGRGRRKRKVIHISGLNDCECGLQADPSAEGVVQCKRDGCETQWWHLECVELEIAPKNWVCRTCKTSGGGKGGKAARK